MIVNKEQDRIHRKIADDMWEYMSGGMPREEAIAIVHVCYNVFEEMQEDLQLDRPDLRFMRSISANRQNR